ncbi:MAG TPA: helix-turn-helix transcriptional regulator [Blastocatellia bacterium]|nr:helix-turn-helix transcriptional regulator [Blastocatellia bacterium]
MKIGESRKIGELLREWRGRRRLSQLDLALDAGISPKHLSFIETGRTNPSREMILHLAEQLALPLRERNLLLTSAGFAAVFPEHSLNDQALEAARETIDLILRGHEPNPALVLDRHWNLITANRAVEMLLKNVKATQLRPPVNVLRLSLHPDGLAPQIVNLGEWKAHLLVRLRRQIEITADAFLLELERELEAFPAPSAPLGIAGLDGSQIAIPFRLRTDRMELSFISTSTIFGTPIDITLAELAIESFFPADPATAQLLKQWAPAGPG